MLIAKNILIVPSMIYMLNHVLPAIPWTVAGQTPLSMKFSR